MYRLVLNGLGIQLQLHVITCTCISGRAASPVAHPGCQVLSDILFSSHTVQFLNWSDLTLQSSSPVHVLALFDPFGVAVKLIKL